MFVDASLHHRLDRLSAMAARMGKRVVSEVANADIFVTQKPGHPSKSVQWAATLSGGCIIDEEHFMSNGARGNCVMHHAAIQTGGSRCRPRVVWASPKFRRQHSKLYRGRQLILRKPTSVWCEMPQMEKFALELGRAFSGPKRQHRPLQAVALLGRSENLEGVRSFSVESFIAQFKKLDARRSALGVCQL